MKENATEIDWIKRLESDIRNAAKPTEDADQIIDTVAKHNIPCLVVNSDSVLKHEGDESTASGYYVDPLDPSKNFSFTGATIMKV